jgi:hypothetical protein
VNQWRMEVLDHDEEVRIGDEEKRVREEMGGEGV